MNWSEQRSTVIFSVIVAVLFIFFSFSLWFYRNILNETAFQSHVSKALQLEESRNAIASLIIEQGFQKRPLLRNILLDQAQPALAGVLNSPRVQTLQNRFIDEVHDSLFSDHPRAITLDISGIKGLVENLIFLIETISGNDVADITIPDSIVLVRAGEIPSILTFGMTVLWVGPFALLLGIGLALWLFWRARVRSVVFQILGVSMAVISGLSILLLKWYQPILLARFQNTNTRIVVENITNEFLQSFLYQNLLLFILGVIFCIGGYLYQAFYVPRFLKRK